MSKRGGMPGMGGGFNPGMLKQIQKMQSDITKAQEELETREFSSSSGGGMVSATVNGKHELLTLTIKPEVVDPSDITLLTDLVVAAINSANKEADDVTSEEMGKYTNGLNLPF